MDRKKYSESTLCLKKYCFCRQKNNIVTSHTKNIFRSATKRKKTHFDSEKNIAPPPPFELNGFSLGQLEVGLYDRLEYGADDRLLYPTCNMKFRNHLLLSQFFTMPMPM